MTTHARHIAIALILAIILLLVAAAAARAQDYSGYSGARLYSRFCASCHGDKGFGDGVVAASFNIMVPDLTRIAKRQGGVYPAEKVRQIIDGRTPLRPHGTREMPVWGYEFYAQNEAKPDALKKTDEMVKRLADYVESLQRE
jgi:mono/diheme cytochrome c family protein